MSRPEAPAPSSRSPAARKAARAKKAEREARIVGLLNRGVSVAEIAARERVTLNRMRKAVRAILEKRAPPAPAEYLALQAGRLDEAMLVAYGAMYNSETGANFKAIDSVVKIVREMDRYHGFFPAAGRPEPEPRRLATGAGAVLALSPPVAGRIVSQGEDFQGGRAASASAAAAPGSPRFAGDDATDGGGAGSDRVANGAASD